MRLVGQVQDLRPEARVHPDAEEGRRERQQGDRRLEGPRSGFTKGDPEATKIDQGKATEDRGAATSAAAQLSGADIQRLGSSLAASLSPLSQVVKAIYQSGADGPSHAAPRRGHLWLLEIDDHVEEYSHDGEATLRHTGQCSLAQDAADLVVLYVRGGCSWTPVDSVAARRWAERQCSQGAYFACI